MDRLFENKTALKVLSVIVAIFIWIQANAGLATQSLRALSPMPVTVNQVNPNLTVVSVKPSNVTVDVRGPTSTVDASDMPSQVSASISLAGVSKPGLYSLKVAGAVPPGVGVVSVTPSRVEVQVEKIANKKVPVHIALAGSPQSGDVVAGYKSGLTRASLTGPVSALSQVTQVVGTVSVSGHATPFTSAVALTAVNAAGKIVPRVEVNPATASVNVVIHRKPPQKVVPVIGQIKGQPALGYKVSSIAVYPSTVTLTGTKSVLAGIAQLDTTAINVAGATRTIRKTVSVVLPNGTSALTSDRVTVTVTISANS